MKIDQRKYLEIQITESLDGQLSVEEQKTLEQQLHQFPDLLENYKALQTMPPITKAFSGIQPEPTAFRRLQEKLNNLQNIPGFHDLLLLYFKRYVLTGVFLVALILLSLRFMEPSLFDPAKPAPGDQQNAIELEQLDRIPEYVLINNLTNELQFPRNQTGQ